MAGHKQCAGLVTGEVPDVLHMVAGPMHSLVCCSRNIPKLSRTESRLSCGTHLLREYLECDRYVCLAVFKHFILRSYRSVKHFV